MKKDGLLAFAILTLLSLLPQAGITHYGRASSFAQAKASIPFLLAGGTGDQMSPSIAGNLMVYSHCPTSNCDIWGLDLTTRQAFPISEGSGDDRQPSTDGVRVVWRDGRNSDSRSGDNLLNNFDIYGAYLEERKPFPVATAPSMQNHPSVWGNTVVWADFRNAGASTDQEAGDIYIADFPPGKETLLTTARSAQTRPVTDGRYVVWVDYRNEPSPNGLNADIYAYNLTTKQELTIAAAPDTQNDPAISGNIIVWSDFRKGAEADIYGFDLSTRKEFLISGAPGSQIEPSISGNIVVWRDYRNEPDKNVGVNSDIYGYDLSSQQEFPIYLAPGPQGFPRVWGSLVAWEDSTKGIRDHDIFGATISGVTIPALPVASIAIPGGGSARFPQTGKLVTGIFNDYWQRNGGLAQQGYPISDLMLEQSDLNGKTYRVQYFERAVFEYHPENAPPYNVLLSQLGTFRYKQKYPVGPPIQQPNNVPGSVLFPETGKRVGGKFLEYWQRNGGLPQQGYPISEEFTEVSDLNGKPYLVQYFERAVFELHPENVGTPYEVLLSQLGTFRYQEKYGGR
jgi:beta propeller repeat protein